VTGGAIGQQVAWFDQRVDELFERYLRGRPVADRVFYGASALGDHGVIWLMLGAVRGLRSEDRWRAAVRAAVGIGAESALVNGPVKWLFRRERPASSDGRPLPLRQPLTSSFPSGHASSSFFAAALLSDGDPSLRPLYYSLAVVVALSRIHVKIHHASDVAAGAALGIALGEIGRRLATWPKSPGRRSHRAGLESRPQVGG
jgi:membrane-associated phospholipid phosphatase